ncbi:hypothetical protein GF342_00735 [Candidatus Woesearchaeota archaeon]|nr:hypothetical protein [Candidatus Woesearchaeota archaeon]
METLVQQFVDVLEQVRVALSNGNLHHAKSLYTELFHLYEKINDSPLANYHKELAYDQITKIHKELDTELTAPRPFRANPTLIVVGAIIVMGLFLVILQPSLIGMSVINQEMASDVSLTFEKHAEYAISLPYTPTSLRVSGQLMGGTAKIYADIAGERLLVFDSEKVELTEGSFSRVCLSTCEISEADRVLPLTVEVSDGALFLSSIQYTTDEEHTNSPPEWRGTRTAFDVEETLTIDLKNYFFDADGDDLVFLATTAEGLDVSIQESRLTLQKTGVPGPREITVLASDLKDITRVPLVLTLS